MYVSLPSRQKECTAGLGCQQRFPVDRDFVNFITVKSVVKIEGFALHLNLFKLCAGCLRFIALQSSVVAFAA
jgi:hypothetical protein